jgi:dephospho-CoA kinase
MSISSKPEIIGLSGTFASGKDTLAHYLSDHYHYLHISQGDILRRVAMERYGSMERPILHKLGTELRLQQVDLLTIKALEEYRAKVAAGEPYTGVIISGIRSLGEAKAVKKAGGIMLFVDAPVAMRYQRMVSRQRDSESAISLDEFKAREATEMSSETNDDASFNVLGVRDMADCVIDNQLDLDSFIAAAKRVLHLE